jgi:hypothetical protein
MADECINVRLSSAIEPLNTLDDAALLAEGQFRERLGSGLRVS